MVRITTICPMCEKNVSVETTASAFKFDRASKGLAAQVTCPHCGRLFPHALNKKNADKDKAAPTEPVKQEPAQVITVRANDLPGEPAPEKGKPVFGPLAGSPRAENTIQPGGAWEQSAPPEPKPAFAPAAAAKPAAPFAPLPPAAPPPPPVRKPLPPPPSASSDDSVEAGGKKKLPEWAQYLLLGGGILVIGIVIFALPFGDSEPGKKKAEATPKKKEKDKDKPPATQPTPVPPPGKKLEVAPRPRTAGTPQPGE